ncbi:MAG: PIN domain-containing protein [Candidatus Cloacimonetes bacterium]|nr:PIN domain-containing protein [Candidatus Cloacimonadota bacterium]
MELLQGAKNKQEQIQINNFLNYFDYTPLNEAISSKSIELIKLYSNSHNLLIPDAMIAATSLLNGLPLFTFNLKDFRYIPELTFYNPQE